MILNISTEKILLEKPQKETEMEMQEISMEELEQVSGGVVDGVIGWLVGKALDAAVDYIKTHANGGADEGTWTSIGHSQMGA